MVLTRKAALKAKTPMQAKWKVRVGDLWIESEMMDERIMVTAVTQMMGDTNEG